MEELQGGRDGIFKNGNTVQRPMGKWSPTIHRLLKHLESIGFSKSPQFIGIENEKEILSFVDGETYDYPLVGTIGSEEAVITAGKLLRELHDSTESFLEFDKGNEQTWMLPSRNPQEVICHGDFTPYNVALNGNNVVGIFDFDVSHPAPRIWDLAFSAYSWAPFLTNEGCVTGTLPDQIRRAKLFLDSYGASVEHRKSFVSVVTDRLHCVVNHMKAEAKNGNVKFQQDIDNGHHLGYIADIEYLRVNETMITEGLF